ncbi:MAG: hypothetical protein HQ592_00315 [Planctomycetes bacterium]|nr:hypothetical protein [Planctomycetota bacterium]
MNRPNREKGFFNMGFVALPALCCILAGLLYVSCEDGTQEGEVLTPTDKLEHLRQDKQDLEAVRDQLLKKIEELEATARQAAQLAALKQALLRVTEEISQLQSKINKLEEELDQSQVRRAKRQKAEKDLKEQEEANKKAAERIAELEKKKEREAERQGIWGGHDGPYILLECVKDAAVVYPGAKRIAVDASRDQIRWLLRQADKEKFVAIAVRPSGYGGSFDKFRNIVLEHIEDAAKRGKKIGFCYFPLEERKSILGIIAKGDEK